MIDALVDSVDAVSKEHVTDPLAPTLSFSA